jgi:mannose-6-phosphate isomerase-like protein (cupin superfamily)
MLAESFGFLDAGRQDFTAHWKEGNTMPGYAEPIDKQTLNNTYFRHVIFTGDHAQLVVMCLQPGEEIGDEVHANVDQSFRIEQGEATFVLNQKEE